MLLTVSLRYFGNTLDINNQRVPHLEPNTRQPSLCPRLPGPLDTQTLTGQQQHTSQSSVQRSRAARRPAGLTSLQTHFPLSVPTLSTRGDGEREEEEGRRQKAAVAEEASGPGYSQDILEQRRT